MFSPVPSTNSYLTARPLTQISGMTQRDGYTFAILLNELYLKFNVEIPKEFDAFYKWVKELYDTLNDRIGSPVIQYVDLVSDYVITVNPDLPPNHVVMYAFTQNTVGGHNVTLGEHIHGDIVVDKAIGALTYVMLVPRGDGEWDAYTYDSLLASVIVEGSQTQAKLQEMIESYVDPKFDAFTSDIIAMVADLNNQFEAFETSVNIALAGVASQIDASMKLVGDKALTYDEVLTSVFFACWREPGTNQAIMSSHDDSAPTFLVAPFNMRIIGFSIIFDRFDLATSDANYLRMRLRKRERNTPDAITTIAEKKTTSYQGEAIKTRVPWDFDAAEWNEANRFVTAGDVLTLHWDFFGTAPQLDFPFTIIVRYAPF